MPARFTSCRNSTVCAVSDTSPVAPGQKANRPCPSWYSARSASSLLHVRRVELRHAGVQAEAVEDRALHHLGSELGDLLLQAPVRVLAQVVQARGQLQQAGHVGHRQLLRRVPGRAGSGSACAGSGPSFTCLSKNANCSSARSGSTGSFTSNASPRLVATCG